MMSWRSTSAPMSSSCDIFSCCPCRLLGRAGCCVWLIINVHPAVTCYVPPQTNLCVVYYCPTIQSRRPGHPIYVLGPILVLCPDDALRHSTILGSIATLCHLDPPSVLLPHSTTLVHCPPCCALYRRCALSRCSVP